MFINFLLSLNFYNFVKNGMYYDSFLKKIFNVVIKNFILLNYSVYEKLFFNNVLYKNLYFFNLNKFKLLTSNLNFFFLITIVIINIMFVFFF